MANKFISGNDAFAYGIALSRPHVISAYPITLSKSDYKITFYNYNDTTTFENRFELQFKKNNKPQFISNCYFIYNFKKNEAYYYSWIYNSYDDTRMYSR